MAFLVDGKNSFGFLMTGKDWWGVKNPQITGISALHFVVVEICGYTGGTFFQYLWLKRESKSDQIGFGPFLSCPMLSPNSYDKLPNFTQFHLFVHFYYWASNCVTLSGKAGAQHCQLKICRLLLKNHWRNIKLGLNLKDLSFFGS